MPIIVDAHNHTSPANPIHVVIVDDDPISRTAIRSQLDGEFINTSEASCATELEKLLATTPVDLILLDIMLPDKNGFTLTRELRNNSDIGIILISMLHDDYDRILGLEIGADDYLCKPFNPRELMARIHTVLRRINTGPSNDLTSVIRFGDWKFDLNARTIIHICGDSTRLTSGEFQILSTLVQLPGRVVPRSRLSTLIDPGNTHSNHRSIDVLISRLRKKLHDNPKNPTYLITVHGEGYIFASHPY